LRIKHQNLQYPHHHRVGSMIEDRVL